MLAGRTNEQATEQVRQTWMVVPEAEQRLQQIGPSQEGAIGWLCRPHHHVVATTGADMATIQHEFFCRQPDLARRFIELLSTSDQFAPAGCGMYVHFDHARIGSDGEV